MEISAAGLDAGAAYKLLVGIVVPRPIAWVTTVGDGGVVNAAPFSCYTFVSNDPPMVAVNCGRREGALKDTARNIAAGGGFVVNVVTEELAGPMHETSAEFPAGLGEPAALGLKLLPSKFIKAPRLACSPINLECMLHQIIELGELKSQLVVGEIVMFHIRDDLLDNGKIETRRLRPLARLGGRNYAPLGDIMTMPPAEEALRRLRVGED